MDTCGCPYDPVCLMHREVATSEPQSAASTESRPVFSLEGSIGFAQGWVFINRKDVNNMVYVI